MANKIYRHPSDVKIGDTVVMNKIGFEAQSISKTLKLGVDRGTVVEKLSANGQFFIVKLLGEKFKDKGKVLSYSEIGIRDNTGFHIFNYGDLLKCPANLFETEE